MARRISKDLQLKHHLVSLRHLLTAVTNCRRSLGFENLRAMFPRKPTNLIVAALSFCIVFTSLGPVALAQKKTAPVEATPPPVKEEFKFGEVDLEVLEQADLLDRSA